MSSTTFGSMPQVRTYFSSARSASIASGTTRAYSIRDFIPASFLLRARRRFFRSANAPGDLFEGRAFVHGQVVSLVALDQILRLFLRRADSVGLKPDGGGEERAAIFDQERQD